MADLFEQQRRAELALNAGMLRDLLALWTSVDPTNLAGTIGRFAQVAATLVLARHRDDAALAARFYRLLRASAGIPGEAAVLLAHSPPAQVVVGQLRGAALAGIVNGRRAGMTVDAAARHGFVKMSGSATSLVLSGGRDTVLATSRRDPRSQGWRRVTSGSPCDWCAGQAGEALRSDHFGRHDHCSCTAAPKFTATRAGAPTDGLRAGTE